MTRPIPHIVRYIFGLLRGHQLQVTLNTIIGTLLVLLDLCFVWATKLAIDIATHHSTRITLVQAFSLIAAIMVTRITIGLSSRWIRATLGVKAQNSMRQHIFAQLLRSKWTDIKNFHTGNLTNRIERDVTDVVNFTTESIPSLFTTLTQFTGAFLFLFFMDRTLAIIIVCVIPFFIISSKLYVKKMRNLSHQARDEESRIQSIIQETLQHVMIVKTLQRVENFISQLAMQQGNLHRVILTKTKYATLSGGLLNVGFGTGYFITFVWGASSLSQGTITYGAMLAFIQLVGQIQDPVRNLSKFIPIFITSFTAAERLMEMEDIPQEDGKAPVKLIPSVGINFTDVTFQYTHKSRLIFNHFNYQFPPNSITAIVGETGAGKTTLIRLLLSLISPVSGNIYLTDGKNACYAMQPCMRGNFAYVPQGNTLFSGTIRSNLLLGNPQATEQELKDALHTAAADFVFKKSDGLDTICGEAGDGLSEGQAQRIAIARALLTNGNIFIFDEATSSLDPATEEIVLKRIIQRYSNRTIIFITHRPLVLKYATQQLKL